MFNKNAIAAAAITAISAMTLFANTDSANAMNFKVTRGALGANGETNEGMYSDFHNQDGFITVDFNGLTNDQKNNGFGVKAETNNEGVGIVTGLNASDAAIKYSYGGNSKVINGTQWAPAGWDEATQTVTRNSSDYLAAFGGRDIEVKLDSLFNYFGINWGAAHDKNRYSFYQGDKLVAGFTYGENFTNAGVTYTDVKSSFLADGVTASWQNQLNAYVHFYADSADTVFDRIVISQFGGGGFETDNHSFRKGSKAFDFDNPTSVPEPGVVLGLMGVGGVFLRKRKKSESAA